MRIATSIRSYRVPRCPGPAAALAVLLCCACDDQDLYEPPLSPCSSYLHDGVASPVPDLRAATCQDPAQGKVVLGRADSLSVPGYRTVGPAVSVSLDGPVSGKGLDLLLPLSLRDVPGDGTGGPLRQRQRPRLTVLGRFGAAPAHVTLLSNPAISSAGGGQLRVHLPAHEIAPAAPKGTLAQVATFQVAIPQDVGQKVKRRFTYRAIGGVSMGGLGASVNFFRYPDRWDAVGVMGADPGPDLTYTQRFIRDFFMGGFCTQQDVDASAGKVKLGDLCPAARAPLLGQGEASGTFEDMPIQTGQGIGLTLRRSLYLRANRDLVRALGNWAYYNPVDPYLPPTIPKISLLLQPKDACANPYIIPGTRHSGLTPFYDGRYNPRGEFDVITFCDGGAKDNAQGQYDATKPQQDPVQILLAVDYNGNGRRDPGEAVILQTSEPYADHGVDGLPDAKEPGYDPVKNPDPAGDNYHYLKNPGGTEGNGRYDAGEPYVDAGLDGIKGSGCDIGTKEQPGRPGCFDHGEGNGQFDMNPGLVSWLRHDPHTLLDALSDDARGRLDIYYDAGLRDFFNAQVSTNALFGALAARGDGAVLFDGFPVMQGLQPGSETRFDPLGVDVRPLGRRAFVRYGNPEATAAQVADTGDGRHVGTVIQALNRALVLFRFLLTRWPDPDLEPQSTDDPRLTPKGLTFTMKNGRKTPYGLLLPPGYFEPQNADRTYPVVYMGHGYGMDPEDLASGTGQIILNFMADANEQKRLPKAIMVFIDGRCRPEGEVPKGPVDAAGDLCEEGGFYTDHPEGPYQGEGMIEELDAYLRKQYRLRPPAEVEVDR